MNSLFRFKFYYLLSLLAIFSANCSSEEQQDSPAHPEHILMRVEPNTRSVQYAEIDTDQFNQLNVESDDSRVSALEEVSQAGKLNWKNIEDSKDRSGIHLDNSRYLYTNESEGQNATAYYWGYSYLFPYYFYAPTTSYYYYNYYWSNVWWYSYSYYLF